MRTNGVRCGGFGPAGNIEMTGGKRPAAQQCKRTDATAALVTQDQGDCRITERPDVAARIDPSALAASGHHRLDGAIHRVAFGDAAKVKLSACAQLVESAFVEKPSMWRAAQADVENPGGRIA